MFKSRAYLLSLLFVILSCTSTKTVNPPEVHDEFQWLEEIESPRSIDFAKAENEKTLKAFQKSPFYKKNVSDLKSIFYADDRIPWADHKNGYFYNFWQDNKHVRGIWRRTTLAEYKKSKPKWEILIDLDQLALKEKENWVWKRSSCLPPDEQQCLIYLSRGGKDASVAREFDIAKKDFVKDGFFIPEAKSRITWINKDALYVSTDTGPDSLTESGYPRTVRYLERGKKLDEAPVISEVNKNDQSVGVYIEHTPEKNYEFISKNVSFYQAENYYFENGVATFIPMPNDAELYGLFKNYLLFSLRNELKTSTRTFKPGSFVALPLANIKDKSLASLELVFEPTGTKYFKMAMMTKNYIMLDILDNIQQKVIKVTFEKPNSWTQERIAIGENGMASINSTEKDNDIVTISYSDFLTPPSIYLGDVGVKNNKFTKIKSAPDRFKSSDLMSVQKFAKSKDGTMIPYFIVHKKNIKLDGKNPTILYGYGGFEVPMQPDYLSIDGKLWMSRGGVYVLASIRGGGEFGPEWHNAAVKENHQVVFDDFIAVAEDLIAQKITSPRHLGIQGGSNGGLLVGGTFIQRPDLFNAVLCQVPLLDMLRYHKLLAGASWMDEYGNPDDPKMREIILKYSPYQNVRPDVKYPEVYFFTSTKDDRVHPAHARKMVAKMRSQGHPVYYFENIEGGHAGSANFDQTISNMALEYTYFWEKLK